MGSLDDYTGQWWIPNINNEKIYGSLFKDEDNKFRLELCGIFGNLKDINNIETIPIISGFTKDGKKITLLNSTPISFSMSFPGIPTETYSPESIIIGDNFKIEKDIKFISVKTKYTDLNKWLGIFPIEKNYNRENREINVKYKLPGNFEYKTKNFDLKINFESNEKMILYKEYSILQNSYICFDKLDNLPLQEIIGIIENFSNFLTLCLGIPVYPFDIKAKTRDGNEVELLWNNMVIKKESNLHRIRFLIPFQFIYQNLEICLNNWYNKKEKLEPIINHVIDAYSEDIFHIPMSFIKVVQALEAFSRRMRENYNENLDEYREKVEYILSKIDRDDCRHWLEEELKYSFEPSLNKRLKNILKETKFIHGLSTNNLKYIANRIKKTRNYFTHYDEENKKEIMNNEQIYYATKLMLLSLRILILLELGIENNYILRNIENTNDLSFLSELKRVFNLE